MKKKTSNVPVFFIYAGIIHAIGLALLLPMLITLPGAGSLSAPQPAAIDVEIVPAAPLAAKAESDSTQTSALPSAAPPAEQDAVEPDSGGAAVVNVSPDAQPAVNEEPVEAARPGEEKATAKEAAPAKAAPRNAKKPVVKRSRTAKPATRRPAKTDAKIAPFNGALTGLFTPGAPANRRK